MNETQDGFMLANPAGVSWEERTLAVMWLAAAAFLSSFSAINFDERTQAVIGMTLLIVSFALWSGRRSQLTRIMVLMILGFISVRYMYWRITETIDWYHTPSTIAALTLFLAECYGFLVFALGLFTGIHPIQRSSPRLEGDPLKLPTVDVMVPTYNEDADILELTIQAALDMRYPRERFKVYLCDDGGTEQKRADKDPEKAAAAWARHNEMKALAARLGCEYLTRARNEHAKAGNINEALKNTGGELVLVLDADHVPTRDFLDRTVGCFIQDPKLFLVQTPHFFVNPDPFEKNLGTFGAMPSENEMFYSGIQRGLDFWNSSFFCGSAALMRRSALLEVGGFSGQTVTEDAETALELHSRGYNSFYLHRTMTAGLAPETFAGFIAQRTRWAQGMVQIFLLKNPLFKPGLSLSQRLCYTSVCLFWFFPFARLVYFFAPVLALVGSLNVFHASPMGILAFVVPQLLGTQYAQLVLNGPTRWPIVSELYEMLQSYFSVVGILKVLRNPRAPSFIVTPKGETLEREFISPLGKVFYILFLILVVAQIIGIQSWIDVPERRVLTTIGLIWNLVNIWLILGVIAVVFEQRQQRKAARIPIRYPARVMAADGDMPCEVVDVSSNGVRVRISGASADLVKRGDTVRFAMDLEDKRPMRECTAQIRMLRAAPNQPAEAGLEFTPADDIERKAQVEMAYGNSRAWAQFRDARRGSMSALGGMGFLSQRIFRHFGNQVIYLASLAWARVLTAHDQAFAKAGRPARPVIQAGE